MLLIFEDSVNPTNLFICAMALILSACPEEKIGLNSPNCNPESASFGVDTDLTEADVQEIVDAWMLSDRADMECHMPCIWLYEGESGWETGDQDSCEHNVDAEPGTATSDVVGHVTCAGTGYEYMCD